jgi:hypothetical protein
MGKRKLFVEGLLQQEEKPHGLKKLLIIIGVSRAL